MNVKVCGLTSPSNVRTLAALPLTWAGIIFYPKSPRFVSLTVATALCEAFATMPEVQRVGVFVNATMSDILTHVRAFQLNAIQLHGNETPAFLYALRNALAEEALPYVALIKVISVGSEADIAKTEVYQDVADLLLFDTATAQKGGSGKKFDWQYLTAYKGNCPFLLSGGIGADDAALLQDFHHEKCIGIDLNSRFEAAPGIKDAPLLSTFLKSISLL